MHNAAKMYTIDTLRKNLVCAKLNQNHNYYGRHNIIAIIIALTTINYLHMYEII